MPYPIWPVPLLLLRGPWGWSILGTVWGGAIIGTGLKVFAMNVPRWISTMIYLVMGWLCIIAVYPLVKSLEAVCLFWLACGGGYSFWAVVYSIRKPDPLPGILGFHEIWHLFCWEVPVISGLCSDI